MFEFTPLLGAQSSSSSSSTSTASSSLLELDHSVKILIDIGWDSHLSAESLHAAIGPHVSSLSLILLTHPTLEHIGAYSHCCKHIPHFARIPVFATTPVINLGRTLIADLHAIPAASTAAFTLSIGGADVLFEAPTSDEITAHFNRIHPLKYSQPHQPSSGHVTITAYSAGHTPGGTIWHIQHGLESIVYASDWNQGRERLLSGAAWLGGGAGGGADIIEPLRRPTALICSSRGAERTETLPRKKRDEVLIGLIRETIAQGGKVLIPTDSSARVLELAFLLNETWRENVNGPHADTYRHARIYMASKTSASTVRQLQGMVEWLDESIMRDAEDTGMGNHVVDAAKVPALLEWTHVRPVERKAQFERALRRSNPCVILASDTSLEWGCSRRALEALAGDSRNLIVLTAPISTTPATPDTDTSTGTLATQLAECYRTRPKCPSSTARVVGEAGQTISLKHHTIAPLSAEENVLYQQYLARQRPLHSTVPDLDNPAVLPADSLEEAEESSDDESDDENEGDHQGRALNLSAAILNQQGTRRKGGRLTDAELGVNILLQKRGVHDFDVRGKRGRERMFPFLKSRIKADEFGEIVLAEQFLRAEEREEEKLGPAPVVQQVQQLGEKRKWGGGEAEKDGKKVKRKKREPDDIDALIARATGIGESGNGDVHPPPALKGDEDDNNDVDDDEEEEDDDEGEESDYEPEDSEVGPQKLLPQPDTALQISCRLATLDFSAIHDFRDLQMLIPLISPRKLILIKGTARETEILATACRRILESSKVMAPREGEKVDAGVDTNAWECRLGRGLVGRLRWQDVKGLGVVALSGSLSAAPLPEDPQSEPETKRAKMNSEDPPAAMATTMLMIPSMPVLDVLPGWDAQRKQRRATQPVHVGDLRLADLRRSMQTKGFSANFSGEGTLVVDGCVVVRKGRKGGVVEVEVVGGGGRAFEAVRGVVYGGLAVVAGV